MKGAAAILSVFTAFLLVTSCAVSWAGVKPEAPIIINHDESSTPPLIPILPDDSKTVPPLPEEIKKLLSAGPVAIFDTSAMEKSLDGYPFPHVKISLLVSGNMVVMMTLLLNGDLGLPEMDENSILEISWFFINPDASAPRINAWINLPLIKKIVEELMGGKPDEKIKI